MTVPTTVHWPTLKEQLERSKVVAYKHLASTNTTPEMTNYYRGRVAMVDEVIRYVEDHSAIINK